MIAKLDGFKTYGCVILLLVALAMRAAGWISPEEFMGAWGVFGPLALAALRHAENKRARAIAELLERMAGRN